MRTVIARSVLVASAVLLAGASADAQVVRGGPQVFVGAGGPVALTPGYGYSAASAAPVVYSSGYSAAPLAYTTAPLTYSASAASGIKPYSYYAATAYGIPAREYVGYGADNNFPYYGRPYGHPYDPWTWNYTSRSYYGGVLNRYYYPPLGF